MSISSTQADDGEEQEPEHYQHGSSLTRRRMMQLAGASVVTATASSAAAAEDDDDDDDDDGREPAWYCIDSSPPGEDDQPCLAQTGIEAGVGWLFGSDDDEEDEFQEYLQDEMLRIHGDAYRTALVQFGSAQTSLTWVKDNAELLEARSYAAATLQAFDEIDDGATRDEAIDVAEDAVRDVYAVPYEEITQEAYLHMREIITHVDRWDQAYQEADDPEHELADVFHLRSPGDEWASGQFDTQYTGSGDDNEWDLGNFELSGPGLEVENLNGESFQVTAPRFDADLNRSNAGDATVPVTGYPFLHDYSRYEPAADGDDEKIWVDGEYDYFKMVVEPFDENEYNNVYDENSSVSDGRADAWHSDNYEEALDAVESAMDTVLNNIDEFIDTAYDDIVEGDLTREEVQTLEHLAESADDDEPLALVTNHLAMLGRGVSSSYTTVEFGGRTEWDDEEEEHPDDDEYHPDDDELIGFEASGTLQIDPSPAESIPVGDTLTPDSEPVRDDDDELSPPNVSFTAEFTTGDGETSVSVFDLEDDREFTIIEAQRYDDDGNLEDADELEYSDEITTETPTDYDDLHDRLDEVETFNEEVLETQRELIEELAEDDDTTFTAPTVDGDDILDGLGFGDLDWLRDDIAGIPVWAWVAGAAAALSMGGDS